MDREKNGYFKKNHKLGGRPKKYTSDDLELLADHLNAWVANEAKEKKSGKKISLLSDWCFQASFPLYEFRRYIHLNENFKQAYLNAKAWQEHQISKGALTRNLDARFAQFFLTCHHDWIISKDGDPRFEQQKTNLEKLSDSICETQKNECETQKNEEE